MEEQKPVLKVDEQTANHVVTLSGTANLDVIQQLHTEALRLVRSGKDVVVDWRSAEYVDACVLQELIALGAALGAAGRKLRLAGDNPRVTKYLQLAGVAGCFPPAPD
jgi:anti-anti-sigma regulatory factor